MPGVSHAHKEPAGYYQAHSNKHNGEYGFITRVQFALFFQHLISGTNGEPGQAKNQENIKLSVHLSSLKIKTM